MSSVRPSNSGCTWIVGRALKALVNEDTLLPMMSLGLRKLENICCGHEKFLNKIRNIFCVPDTKFVSATNVARAGKRGNICVGNNVPGTMCPCLPGPLGTLPSCSPNYPRASRIGLTHARHCPFLNYNIAIC